MKQEKTPVEKDIEEATFIYKAFLYKDVCRRLHNAIKQISQLKKENEELGQEVNDLKDKTTKEIFRDIDKMIPRGISPYWDRKEKLKQKYGADKE